MTRHCKTVVLVASLIVIAGLAQFPSGHSLDTAQSSVTVAQGTSSPTVHQQIAENEVAAKMNPPDVMAPASHFRPTG